MTACPRVRRGVRAVFLLQAEQYSTQRFVTLFTRGPADAGLFLTFGRYGQRRRGCGRTRADAALPLSSPLRLRASRPAAEPPCPAATLSFQEPGQRPHRSVLSPPGTGAGLGFPRPDQHVPPRVPGFVVSACVEPRPPHAARGGLSSRGWFVLPQWSSSDAERTCSHEETDSRRDKPLLLRAPFFSLSLSSSLSLWRGDLISEAVHRCALWMQTQFLWTKFRNIYFSKLASCIS